MADKRGKVEFGVDPDCTPLEGVCVVVSLDPEGDRSIEVSAMGDPPTWSMIGMLQIGLDQVRDQMRHRWDEED